MSESATQNPAPVRRSTGTLLIVGVFVVALLAAGASWWFRFAATHRAVRFWGPEAAVLIRDAPRVELLTLQPSAGPQDETIHLGGREWRIAERRDVSAAHGMIHLRNALLEDRSFAWPARDEMPQAEWRWGLRFSDPDEAGVFTAWFSSDCRLVLRVAESRRDSDPRLGETRPRAISCEPIADGLRSFFAELTGEQSPAE